MCGNVLSCFKRNKPSELDLGEYYAKSPDEYTGTKTLRRVDDSRMYARCELLSCKSDISDEEDDMEYLMEDDTFGTGSRSGSKHSVRTEDLDNHSMKSSEEEPANKNAYPRATPSNEDYNIMPRISGIVKLPALETRASHKLSINGAHRISEQPEQGFGIRGILKRTSQDPEIPPDDMQPQESEPTEGIEKHDSPEDTDLESKEK